MRSATTPLYLDQERPWVDLEVEGADKKRHRLRFLIHTGGKAMLLSEAMAQQLGIPLSGEHLLTEEGLVLEKVPPPALFLGNMHLETQTEAFVIRTSMHQPARQQASPMISGQALAGYRLTFDMPRLRFSVSDLGNAWTSGEMLLSPVHPQSHLARVEIEIEGEIYGMLLDTGIGCSLVSPQIFAHWCQEHPDWPRLDGAFGSANLGQRELDDGARMLRIPRFTLGLSQVEGVCVVTRPQAENFESRLENILTGPAIGALGGNVLKHFCYEMNYATGISHLRQQGYADLHNLDMVGLSLYATEHGQWGILKVAGEHMATIIQKGDILHKIDRQPVTGLPLHQVIEALRGWPGDLRLLLLEHTNTGEKYLLTATVTPLL